MKYSTARYYSVPIAKIDLFQRRLDALGYEYKCLGYAGSPDAEAEFEVRKYIHDEEDPNKVWEAGYTYKAPSKKRFATPVLILYAALVCFIVSTIVR